MKKKNEKFSTCLVNHSLRKGKKNKIFKFVFAVGIELSTVKNMDIETFFFFIFNILRPFVEVRNVRVRRTTYLVPFPTSIQRQQHLVSSWFLEIFKKDKRNKPTKVKLREELIKILLNRGFLVEKKKELYRKAEKSRSFMHYRWY